MPNIEVASKSRFAIARTCCFGSETRKFCCSAAAAATEILSFKDILQYVWNMRFNLSDAGHISYSDLKDGCIWRNAMIR